MNYQSVIGLEIHAELKTQTKMFCDSLNDPDEKHPNMNICPVCMGHPGCLPVANMEAIRKVIMAGLALNCKIEKETFFERKNYFYPDLPKGYQITQFQKPFCHEGWLEIGSKKIRITRIHLEEDAGRLYHEEKEDYSLVDYNRAGMPLMELVTEPDFQNGEEVRQFAQELQLILRYLGVSDADMEKGLMRVEVNISLKGNDGKFGTKVEIKNLNSIKAAADCVDYEIKRQSEILEEGEKVKQETRGWDENKKRTFSQRSKEESHDYRYFPEPDLPPVHLTDAQIEEIRSVVPELPQQRRSRFKEYGIKKDQINIFVTARHLGDYFEHVSSELDAAASDFHKKKNLKGDFSMEPHINERLHLLAANYIITEFPVLMNPVRSLARAKNASPKDLGEATSNGMNAEGMEVDDLEGFKISPEAFAELMVLIFHKEVSSTGAQTILKEMASSGSHPEQIIKEKDLGQMSEGDELKQAVAKVIDSNKKAVEDYKKGKEASIKFFVGMVMRETKGKANPQVVEELLKEELRKTT
jgi:aspartyl-tRNA(Asn)/glutamyl-tRNA(Gln) amidotransferase subunit B